MSDTDGTAGRPSSGPSGPSGFERPGQSGTDSTRPLSTVGPKDASGKAPVAGSGAGKGSGPKGAGPGAGPKGAGPKGAGKAPAAATKPVPGTTANAVAVKDGPGEKVVPAKKAAPPRPRPAAPAGRRVRLTVSRIDPWSAMKMSFLLSVALGIALVVMTFVLWGVLNAMGVFGQINDIAANLFPVDSGEPFDLMDYVGLARVMSLAIVVGVIDVILITALATLSAFLYNVSAALVGGLQLTLTDD